MPDQGKKIALEMYGLARLALGAAQLGGLCFAYFLLEFVIRYPSGQLVRVFDEDALALIFFAVIFRGIFHMVVGIGIARLHRWVNYWIYWGWPFIAIINFGVFYLHWHEFQLAGDVSSVWEVIHVPQAFLYFALIAFDWVGVTRLVERYDEESSLVESGGRLAKRKILAFFALVVLGVGTLLFLGEPVKQGFHQGFYKSRGKVSVSGERKEALVAKRKPSRGEQTVQISPEHQKDSILVDATLKHLPIDEQKQTGELKEVKGKKPASAKGLPYKNLLGLLGGLSLVAGLGLQLFYVKAPEGSGSSGSNPGLLVSYGFLSLGFLLGAIFSLASDEIVNFSFALVCFFLCLAITGRLAVSR